MDHLATNGTDVTIIVDVVREADGRRGPFDLQYTFDYHWGDLVCTGEGRFYACATVKFAGKIVAYGETNRVELA